MKIDLVTLFPGMIEGFLASSMLGRAAKAGIVEFRVHNLRDWSTNTHKTVDDRPFGGGAGMLLSPEPLHNCLSELKTPESTTIYLCPDGIPLKRNLSIELAQKESHLILLSGHYEGIDERIRETLVDMEVSIGDYILTNGTLAAAVLVDSLCRFLPGVLGEEKSLTQDSFHDNLLSFPQYTRPANFQGHSVPEVLLGGNHAEIDKWRKKEQLKRTQQRRPDLLS